MCFRSKRYYELKVRELEEERLTNHAVIQSLSNMSFKQAVEIQQLKEEKKLLTQDRDSWRDIAHNIDRARREMLRRVDTHNGYNNKKEEA